MSESSRTGAGSKYETKGTNNPAPTIHPLRSKLELRKGIAAINNASARARTCQLERS